MYDASQVVNFNTMEPGFWEKAEKTA